MLHTMNAVILFFVYLLAQWLYIISYIHGHTVQNICAILKFIAKAPRKPESIL